METGNQEPKTFQLNIRITHEMELAIRARAAKSGRSITAETMRLIDRAMQLDEMLGARAESGFDLAIAFASGGGRSVVKELMDRHGVTVSDLAAWTMSGKPA